MRRSQSGICIFCLLLHADQIGFVSTKQNNRCCCFMCTAHKFFNGMAKTAYYVHTSILQHKFIILWTISVKRPTTLHKRQMAKGFVSCGRVHFSQTKNCNERQKVRSTVWAEQKKKKRKIASTEMGTRTKLMSIERYWYEYVRARKHILATSK